jgi:hypothetical protein
LKQARLLLPDYLPGNDRASKGTEPDTHVLALSALVPRALGLWAIVGGVFPWIVVLVLWVVTRRDFSAFTSWGPDT